MRTKTAFIDPHGPVEAFLSVVKAVGEENRVSTNFCMGGLGVSDVRLFRQLVERERASGALILANSRGLFLPDEGEKGRAELIKFVRTGEARIRGQARALRPARRELKRMEMEGQVKIEEGGGAGGEA